MTVKIVGKIKPEGGEGKARTNYKAMIPKAAEYCSEIKGCDKYGSINLVELNPPLRKSHADCWTPQVVWHPIVGVEQLGKDRPEVFGFTSLGSNLSALLGGQTYDAWIISEGQLRSSTSNFSRSTDTRLPGFTYLLGRQTLLTHR